jgi:hypothetical protein
MTMQTTTIDGITYNAHHIAGKTYMMIKIGKRGQETKAHRPAILLPSGAFELRRWVR